MTKTIRSKIFMYMLIFSFVIVSIIAVGTNFFLPSYYLQSQVNYIIDSEEIIKSEYKNENFEKVIVTMEEMKNKLGGELYYYSEGATFQSSGAGRGQNRFVDSNAEKFVPKGNISSYTYTNKIGLDIYVIGVLINENYLVYEVNIQTLNQATETMMNFIWILLLVVLIFAIIISFILSKNISNPIKKLNVLAESMKNNNISPYIVTKDRDEIYKLNQTLNELYEELQGSIYKLNTELSKERNSELLKKRFLAQATHELKTPIAVIRGYAEILYDGMYKDEKERDQFIKNIYDETESVSHLILDVLDYTKMETGNYKLYLKNISMKVYMTNLFNRYKPYITKHNIELIQNINISDSLKKDIDPDRLDQVYKNLISNAVEHAKSHIIVKAESISNKIRLSVYNDGSHIADEDLLHLFDSFYKRKGKKKGTGLGLAISKEIILLHGGEYRARNINDGVEFIIII